MKKTILLGLLIIGGCSERINGPTLTEYGTVLDTYYVPSGHGDGTGAGFTSSGKTVFTITSIDIPARYAVGFKCQHGQFVVEGNKGEQFYKTLSKGDNVQIDYCNEFNVTETSTNFVKLHFLNATKIK